MFKMVIKKLAVSDFIPANMEISINLAMEGLPQESFKKVSSSWVLVGTVTVYIPT